MTHPTVLSPWFVVQKIAPGDRQVDTGIFLVYFSAASEGAPWTDDPKKALLFMSLQSAARIADAEVAEVRVLYSKDQAEEFGR